MAQNGAGSETEINPHTDGYVFTDHSFKEPRDLAFLGGGFTKLQQAVFGGTVFFSVFVPCLLGFLVWNYFYLGVALTMPLGIFIGYQALKAVDPPLRFMNTQWQHLVATLRYRRQPKSIVDGRAYTPGATIRTAILFVQSSKGVRL